VINVAVLAINKDDYDFIQKYVDSPFKGYKVITTGLGYNLFYGDEEAFDHFSTNYNFGLVEHDMSGPDYEINSIGKRMETIYDNLFSQI